MAYISRCRRLLFPRYSLCFDMRFVGSLANLISEQVKPNKDNFLTFVEDESRRLPFPLTDDCKRRFSKRNFSFILSQLERWKCKYVQQTA